MAAPFSQACENNKIPIVEQLKKIFTTTSKVLEVGSGTGQHAVFFAAQLPHLIWQPTDLTVNHYGINAWRNELPSPNLKPPLELDVSAAWPVVQVDGIFTANTLHIMSWELVKLFFQGVGKHLALQGRLVVYGPFKYQGQFTSESNAQFDLWLKAHDSARGVRNIEDVVQLAQSVGLALISDTVMPANNQLLVFEKQQHQVR
ncbi:DUF938 domain-containing protein [Pseudoalteromonas tunicata]|uniref:DUF938 domain-containing protein n=1 Tax=Pseudoalteromonas tunicata TaxID=314281 RepID=UPI00273E4361|nr:DUF938 domain-containing protein [Pseudoalteromonas tunicata]MDP4984578.1 class I SAM-dependent methyltransferase [Pseudoalteromonas tunicata]